jgi:hypothetical protein
MGSMAMSGGWQPLSYGPIVVPSGASIAAAGANTYVSQMANFVMRECVGVLPLLGFAGERKQL